MCVCVYQNGGGRIFFPLYLSVKIYLLFYCFRCIIWFHEHFGVVFVPNYRGLCVLTIPRHFNVDYDYRTEPSSVLGLTYVSVFFKSKTFTHELGLCI